METVRRPRVKIVYEGRDITQDIESYLTGVEYVDNTAGESDEVSFTVHDAFGQWRGAWFPFKGDRLTLALGYEGNLLNCGTFTVDEIELSGPPDIVNIRALASGIGVPLRTTNSKAFEAQSLRQIAEEIAKKYGYSIVDGETKKINSKVSFDDERSLLTTINGQVLQATRLNAYKSILAGLRSVASTCQDKGAKAASDLIIKYAQSIAAGMAKGMAAVQDGGTRAEIAVIKALRPVVVKLIKQVKPMLVDYTNTSFRKDTVLDGIYVERITQNRETDLEFLARVSKEYGILFSIRGDQMIFASISQVEGASSVRTIDRTELISYNIKEKATKVYKKAVVTHHNKKKNKVTKAEIEAKAQAAETAELRINSEHASSEDTLYVYSKVDNMQQAEQKARAALHLANSKHQEGSITVPGNPLLVAGNNFELTGLGGLSGKFHIISSTHRIGRDGYITDLEIKRIGDIKNIGEKMTAGEVLFDTDSSVIRPAGIVEIERVIAWMRATPDIVVEVAGHTDNVATGEYNQGLSERRSNAVRDYMIAQGILATRLVAKGYGEIRPVASNSTPEGRQKNRRTEFVVIRNI